MIFLGYLPCHIQIKLNKRRRKRKGKKEKTPTVELYTRIYSVLETGRLSDYTHPREVDPYWNKLYLQYEYLTYLIIAVEKEIEKEKQKSNSNFKYIDELEQDLNLLKQKRKKIFDYMYNFMIIIQGTVLKNRFYGWRRYTQEFLQLFTEQALDSITRLNFDPDKSRPSIYFYQIFWLTGIGLTKKIQELLDKSKEDENYDTGRGSKLFSTFDDIDEENQEYYEKAIQTLFNEDDDEITNFDQKEEQDLDHQEVITDTEKVEIEKVQEKFLDDKYIDINEEDETEENDEEDITDVVHYLLKQANINPDIIYSDKSDNKMFNDIGKFIRRLIKKGKIKLTDKQQEILRKYGIKL